MAPTLPFTALPNVEVFATEDVCAQVIWRDLPAGTLGAVVNGKEQTLGEAGRPGAGDVDGLAAGSSHPVDITLDGRVICQRTIHTDHSLDGPELSRIATISDLHLGENGFGFFKKMRDADHADFDHASSDYPLRCAQAAVREAEAWGAQLLVIKGDITNHGQREEWALFDELLEGINIPVVAIPGNHDTVEKSGSLDATTELQRRGLFPENVLTVDIPGARLVAANTALPKHTWGKLTPIADELIGAADVDLPVLLFIHHHLETHIYPRIWPLGARRRDAVPVIGSMARGNPDLFITSGHTHRNRKRQYGTALVTEVGSTKDHPGVWGGYVFHQSGVRQVVRRVAEPSCIAWTDKTHAVVGGVWGQWSPGRLTDRSFSHQWARAALYQEPAASSDSEWPMRSRLVWR